MLSSRLFWRIFVSAAVILLGLAAVLSVVIPAHQRDLALKQIDNDLQASCLLLREDAARALEETPHSGLDARLGALHAETGFRASLVRPNGTVVAGPKIDDQGALLELPEMMAARTTGVGRFYRRGTSSRPASLSRALRIGDESEPAGYLLVRRELTALDAQTSAVRGRIWGAVAIFGLPLFLVASWLAASIRRPVDVVRRAAVSLGQGVFDQDVAVEQRDELGTLARDFGNMRDQLRGRLSELEEQNVRLEESSQRLSTVLAGMIEGVIAVNNSERILFLNRAARSFLDVTSSNVVGRPIWEVIRNPTLQEIVRDALQGGEPRTGEFELPRTKAIVALIVSRLPGDPCPGVVLVLHDVTELRRLENLRSEFVSNVSHELKTPLAAIQAYAETLLAGAIDDPEHNREFLRRIEEQGERLHNLVLDLLNLARIESGADVFDITVIDVHDAIKHCLDEHAAVAEANGVSLTIEPPDAGLCVRADREGLRTILGNLVDNAIKYTPSGGRVSIRCDQDGGMVQIAVHDTGVGIPESQKARIFERFYRIDKARSREMGGTGLGLSIVKHLTQVFGGTVGIESRVGEGSTFIVRLPQG